MEPGRKMEGCFRTQLHQEAGRHAVQGIPPSSEAQCFSGHTDWLLRSLRGCFKTKAILSELGLKSGSPCGRHPWASFLCHLILVFSPSSMWGEHE